MNTILCMEIGTSTVRLAEITKRGNTVEILKTSVFDTPDDATKDGKVRVNDSVVSAIKNGIYDSGIKATDVYFVVQSSKILFKQVELPLVSDRQIQGTLELSFSDIFPVDETLYHISYVAGKKFERDGKKMMELDVFAIPNDLSESYYNLAVALDLNAKGLTDANRSMMSLFPTSFKLRNVAMVNINENSSTCAVSVDGDMVFSKTISNGVYDAIRQVINSPLTMDDLDIAGATGLLYTKPILMRQVPDGIINEEDEEEKLRYGVTTSIAALAKQIEAVFTQYLQKERLQIQEFQLSGLGAGFDGISNLLTSIFGIPVTIVQQEDNLRINETAVSDVLLLSCYPCVGSVIDKANFFTAEEKAGGEIAKRRKIDRVFMVGGVIACLAFLGYGAYSWLGANELYHDAYDENVRLQKRVDELKALGVETAYNDYITAQSYNEEVLNLYKETTSGNEEMTVFLEELESVLPRSACVTNMNLTPSTAQISFSCENKFVAAGVLHLLRNMNTIYSMECRGVGEVESTGAVVFQCTFQLKTTEDRDKDNAEQENGENNNGENNNGENNNGENGENGENSDGRLIDTTAINTEDDLALIKFGDILIDAHTMTVVDWENAGFATNHDYSYADTKALEFYGFSYSDSNGNIIAIAESDDGIQMMKVSSDQIEFYKGLRVGMTVDEALVTIGNENVILVDGFIVIKNAHNAIILSVSDTEEALIESVYIVNFEQEDSGDNPDNGSDENEEQNSDERGE